MSYANIHENLTPEARKRGREAGLRRRNEKRHARIAQVQLMITQGLSKAEIARRLGVSNETIRRDCKTFEENPVSVATSIIDAVFVVVRDESAGEISTIDARQQVQDLIGLAIKNEIFQRRAEQESLDSDMADYQSELESAIE